MYRTEDILPSQAMLGRIQREGGSAIRTGTGVGDWRFQKTPTSISEALSQEDRPMAERLSIANRMRMEQEQIKGLKDWEKRNVPGAGMTGGGIGGTGGMQSQRGMATPRKSITAQQLLGISRDPEKLKEFGFGSRSEALAEARRLAEEEEEEYGLEEIIRKQSERKWSPWSTQSQNSGSPAGMIDSSYKRMIG